MCEVPMEWSITQIALINWSIWHQVIWWMLHFQENHPKPHPWKMEVVRMSCMASPGWNMDRTVIYQYPNSWLGMRHDYVVPDMVRLQLWSQFTLRTKITSFMIICRDLSVGPVPDGLVYTVTPKVMLFISSTSLLDERHLNTLVPMWHTVVTNRLIFTTESNTLVVHELPANGSRASSTMALI